MKITNQNKHILDNNKPIVCVYHDPCQDGISSAWVVFNALSGRELQFVPDNYNEHRAEFALTPTNLKNKHLIITDYSFSAERMIELSKLAETVTILDHHTKSKDEIVPLLESGDIHGVFDMKKSGCLVTWDFFHAEEAPLFLQHISDRDLFTFNLPDSRAIYYACLSDEYNVVKWDQMIRQCSTDVLAEIGRPILEKSMQEIPKIAATSELLSVRGWNVPVVEVKDDSLSSEVCAYIYKESDVPFVVAYCKHGAFVKVSFRSKLGSGVNVNEIAMFFGGGGHIHASGVKVSSIFDIVD